MVNYLVVLIHFNYNFIQLLIKFYNFKILNVKSFLYKEKYNSDMIKSL